MLPCGPRTRISRLYINASPSAVGRSGPSLPWRTPLCVVSFTCSPAMKGTVNWGPIILTNGGGSSRSIGSPGGLNAWGIGCILNRWQHPQREKFSRQPLTVPAEACTLVAATEERWWEAEVYRLQGALLFQLPRPDVPQAEACFQQALAVARRQEAKSLELRAAMSLVRLWQQQGKGAEAHSLLAPICGWFTEGFDTADLREAKALLEELGG